MTSFFSAALRLLLNRHPDESRITQEHAQGQMLAQMQAQAQAQSPSGALSGSPAVPPPMPGANSVVTGIFDNRPIYIDPKADRLTFFRLMLGIQTAPYLGFTISSPIGTRPAPNIGLYARIVHSEQKAKDNFKVFSIVINGCYFLQIVIAAALTALGAARASSGAVTAFGALNTVIAGLLTFLKGSGLPGRFKYYGNEWKKIREFIEQRERDFMRPGNDLDVYEVVGVIEQMYNNLKADIEINTPDSYTSVTSKRRTGDDKDHKIEVPALKPKSLDTGKSESFIEKIEDEVEHFRGGVGREVQRRKARLSREVDEHEAQVRAAITGGKRAVEDGVEDHIEALDNAAKEQHDRMLTATTEAGRVAQEGISNTVSHATGSVLNLVRELSEIHRVATTSGRTSAIQQMRNLASRLEAHGDKHKEPAHDAETQK
ncbi:hypothetical protein F4861DRAFT_14930 [Xylaria intraflava]|nr:hypothetical protein F4861DRAFT_14930 [Xylaria intraflava]